MKLLEWLLRLCPDEFRRAHAEEIQDFAREEHAARCGGALSRIRFWLRLWVNVSLTAFRLRRAQRTRGRSAPVSELAHALVADVCRGVRSIHSTPLVSLVIILTLACGIGLNTAIYSVVHGVLLDPLPYERARPTGFPECRLDVRRFQSHERQPHRQLFSNATPRSKVLLRYRRGSGIFARTLRGSTLPRRFWSVGRRRTSSACSASSPSSALDLRKSPRPEQPSSATNCGNGSLGATPTLPVASCGSTTIRTRSPAFFPRISRRTCRASLAASISGRFRTIGGKTATSGTRKGAEFALLDLIARLRPGITVAQAQSEMEAFQQLFRSEHIEYEQLGVEYEVLPCSASRSP